MDIVKKKKKTEEEFPAWAELRKFCRENYIKVYDMVGHGTAPTLYSNREHSFERKIIQLKQNIDNVGILKGMEGKRKEADLDDIIIKLGNERKAYLSEHRKHSNDIRPIVAENISETRKRIYQERDERKKIRKRINRAKEEYDIAWGKMEKMIEAKRINISDVLEFSSAIARDDFSQKREELFKDRIDIVKANAQKMGLFNKPDSKEEFTKITDDLIKKHKRYNTLSMGHKYIRKGSFSMRKALDDNEHRTR